MRVKLLIERQRAKTVIPTINKVHDSLSFRKYVGKNIDDRDHFTFIMLRNDRLTWIHNIHFGVPGDCNIYFNWLRVDYNGKEHWELGKVMASDIFIEVY